ncbi:MAG: GGDEF domain-containing protein [Gammaproteobacteria bacterium]|nr:GGDEF domain-containing protein [Gammaproteobacteria bacterium]
MIETTLQLENCPLQAYDCAWLHELASLRQQNQALELLVTTDTLTQLYNYRYFRDLLSREMDSTQRTGRTTCIIMIDLDHFKSVNDERGHEAGNQALILAANVFRQAVRSSDVVCRYGGEEFVVVLPQTTLHIAINVAERMRDYLQQSTVQYDDESFQLTASFGVGTYSGETPVTLESFVDSADQYLYQAKQQGRNRVCHVDLSTLKQETTVSAEEKSALFNNSDD